jgi:hypothetical protein
VLQQVLNGYADEQHVVVYNNWLNNWIVFINGVEQAVFKVGTLRSEKTVVITLKDGREIIVPTELDREAWVIGHPDKEHNVTVVL